MLDQLFSEIGLSSKKKGVLDMNTETQKTIDDYSNFKTASSNKTAMIRIHIGKAIFPKKTYQKTNGILMFEDTSLKFIDATTSKLLLSIDLNSLDKIEIGRAKTFLGDASGLLAATLLIIRFSGLQNNG